MDARSSRIGFMRLLIGAGYSAYAGLRPRASVSASHTLQSIGASQPCLDCRSISRRVQSTQSDPDSAAIDCLLRDDTKCAVDVWEEQFALEPFNDLTRENLHLSLIVHSLRSIDKGNLGQARAGLERAQELVTNAPQHFRLEEMLESYQRPLFTDLMDRQNFEETVDADSESRYVEIPGILGGQTEAFALTAKRPGYFYWYTLGLESRLARDFSYRFLVSPMSFGGTIDIILGYQGSNDFLSVELSIDLDSFLIASVYEVRSNEFTSVGQEQYIQLDPLDWHRAEVRILGNTLQVWMDSYSVIQEVVLNYVEGDIGFGVGLNQYATGTTYSVAFDDMVVYSLAD